MKKIIVTVVAITVAMSGYAYANVTVSQKKPVLPTEVLSPLSGFSINGEAINPVCIGKMRPGIGESGIIIKSIDLEQCQQSNWGSYKGSIEVDGDSVSAVGYDEIENAEQNYSYQVIGKTDSGLFILFHEGYVAAYSIQEEAVKPDLIKPENKNKHILKVIGHSLVPCFKHGEIKGNRIVIEKFKHDLNAARPDQCKSEIELVEFQIN